MHVQLGRIDPFEKMCRLGPQIPRALLKIPNFPILSSRGPKFSITARGPQFPCHIIKEDPSSPLHHQGPQLKYITNNVTSSGHSIRIILKNRGPVPGSKVTENYVPSFTTFYHLFSCCTSHLKEGLTAKS